jgi:hypothetical protein
VRLDARSHCGHEELGWPLIRSGASTECHHKACLNAVQMFWMLISTNVSRGPCWSFAGIGRTVNGPGHVSLVFGVLQFLPPMHHVGLYCGGTTGILCISI